MNTEKKLEIIKRNIEEIVTEKELRKLLKEKKSPAVYLGTAITKSPHIGYFFPVLKLADFLKAGFKVKVLLADLHGALDNTPWEVLEERYEYYKKIIPLIFKAVGVDAERLEFIKGSDFQLTKDYEFDILKMSTFASQNDCRRAASEVVKFGENPKLSGLIYPIMQALDEQHLGVDVQFGGIDQRKIFMFARENLPKLGYKRRIEIMIPLIPGLVGKKMSSSDSETKIDLMDSESSVRAKIMKADCAAGDVDNGIMAFLKYVIMVIKQDKKEKFAVKRDKKYGGDLIYKSFEAIERDFKDKKLHPLDLKNAVADEINNLLKVFRNSKEKLEKLKKKAFE